MSMSWRIVSDDLGISLLGRGRRRFSSKSKRIFPLLRQPSGGENCSPSGSNPIPRGDNLSPLEFRARADN